jgi:DNA-binding GntR family transcriptional regulator
MTMPGPGACRRLVALLRDQIISGILAPGRAAPAGRGTAPAAWHSRQMLTTAMGVLQEQGLICRRPGPGSFAADKDE